jgi:hypothetical protein
MFPGESIQMNDSALEKTMSELSNTYTTTDDKNEKGGRLGFTRREAPRSQVQEVVYTDSKKNIILAYCFKSTLARPQKVGTFQILG